jgi:hypothetical protein
MSLEIGNLIVECFDEDSEMTIRLNDGSKCLDVEDVKELVHFLQSHLYHETGELPASRWRGEQGLSISKEAIENALYATKRFLSTEASDLAEGIIDYLQDANVDITIPCGARWVNGTPDDDNLHPIKYGSKLQFMAAGFFANNRWHINGDTVVLEKNTPVQYLSESPCTCQSLPSREEAEKWGGQYADKVAFRVPYDGSNKFYDDNHHKWATDAALAMYDWLASHQKPIPTRQDVNEWCNAHSSMIAANPMYAIRKFYNWIFNNKK